MWTIGLCVVVARRHWHQHSVQGERNIVNSHESPDQTECQPLVRSLRIEEDGDQWRGFRPKIRLMGRWLERAGFAPGKRVHVTCISPGVIKLRASNALTEAEQRKHS